MVDSTGEIGEPPVSGTWHGVYSYGNGSQSCKFILRLEVDEQGLLRGSILEDKHKEPAPVAGTFDKHIAVFSKSGEGGWMRYYEPARFEGRFSDDSTKMSGYWANEDVRGNWTAWKATTEMAFTKEAADIVLPTSSGRARSTYQKLAGLSPSSPLEATGSPLGAAKPKSTFSKLQALAQPAGPEPPTGSKSGSDRSGVPRSTYSKLAALSPVDESAVASTSSPVVPPAQTLSPAANATESTNISVGDALGTMVPPLNLNAAIAADAGIVSISSNVDLTNQQALPGLTSYVSTAMPSTLDVEASNRGNEQGFERKEVCPRCGAERGLFSFCTACGHTYDLSD